MMQKKQRLYGAATLSILIAICLFLYWRHDQGSEVIEGEDPALTILLRGSLEEAEAMERLLAGYSRTADDFRYTLAHDSTDTAAAPTAEFNLILADAASLLVHKDKLQTFDLAQQWFSLSPAMTEPVTSAEGVYGLPFYEHSFVALYYDKAKVSTQPKSWQELALMVGDATNRLTHNYGLALGEETSLGLPFFGESFSQNWSTDAQDLALGFEELSRIRHSFPVVPLDCRSDCANAIFRGGKAPFALAPEWLLKDFEQAISAERLGIMPLPDRHNKSSKVTRQTRFLGLVEGLNKSQSDAAAKLLAYWKSEAGQNQIFREFRKVPSPSLEGLVQLQDRIAVELKDYLVKSSVYVSRERYDLLLRTFQPTLSAYYSGKLADQEAAHLLAASAKLVKDENFQY